MKRGQFSPEQITLLLRRAETGETTISQICRETGITEQAFSRWRTTFGRLSTDDAQRLRTLEQENARLQRLLAERDLEVDALRTVLTKKC